MTLPPWLAAVAAVIRASHPIITVFLYLRLPSRLVPIDLPSLPASLRSWPSTLPPCVSSAGTLEFGNLKATESEKGKQQYQQQPLETEIIIPRLRAQLRPILLPPVDLPSWLWNPIACGTIAGSCGPPISRRNEWNRECVFVLPVDGWSLVSYHGVPWTHWWPPQGHLRGYTGRQWTGSCFWSIGIPGKCMFPFFFSSRFPTLRPLVAPCSYGAGRGSIVISC